MKKKQRVLTYHFNEMHERKIEHIFNLAEHNRGRQVSGLISV